MGYRDDTRYLSQGEGSAIAIDPWGNVYKYNTPQVSHNRKDLAGVRDGYFEVTKTAMNNMGITSKRYWRSEGDESWTTTFKNFVGDYFYNGGPMSHLPDPSRPSNSDLAVRLMAGTNPSRPVVNLPVAIFELRELPDLIRSFGRQAIIRMIRARKARDIASFNLAYQFGLKPMISDVSKLLDFQTQSDNRLALLKKLQNGPLLRKMQLYSSSVDSEPNTAITSNSSPSLFVVDHVLRRISTSRKVWGYVKWSPTSDFASEFPRSPEGDAKLNARARQIVLGMTLDTYTLWEALPWSWLVDWFGNCGDWLSSKRNLVPVSAETPRICETTTTVYSWECVNCSTNREITGGKFGTTTLTSKTRNLASAALPSAHLPGFSAGQMNILSSLAVLRLR